VTLRISYGSEKQRLLDDSVEAFDQNHPTTASGAEIKVEPIREVSTETMESLIAEQRSDVSVWWPASSLQSDLFDDRWARAHHGRSLFVSARSIELSPIVIAMWEPMARALGRPEIGVGWDDMAKLASEPRGWARFGLSQYGRFSFGHPHPRHSAAGMMCLVALTYAGAGKASNLSGADVVRAEPFVRQVEESVVHYGPSSGLFADEMFSRGPSHISAVAMYENQVIDSSSNPHYFPGGPPVVAIYPKAGTVVGDNPYIILDLPGLTPDVRDAAKRFQEFLLSKERQRVAMRFGFRPRDASIPLDAPFDARHGVDPTEPRVALPNPPAYVLRAIMQSFESVKRPAAITLLVDVSAATRGSFDEARSGASVVLEALPAEHSVRLLLAGETPRWLSEKVQPVSEVRASIGAALASAAASGSGALYDAILAATRPAPNAASDARNVVIVFTPGIDAGSRTSLTTLLERIGPRPGASGARIFLVAQGPTPDLSTLTQIAQAGEGEVLSGDPKDVRALADQIRTYY
jgi:Ca-activated chloride channel family protein